ncbi:Oidioi.mRNA.OKI2018_I69.XSR.g14687.t1.cds [Oikopleura dioica]|uniref:Oidioi.mRNA.OKI2018_I69.XSR.g14687.t1.cds n=1 Tax=Oikopleura dioica TaxID=34765 RepID=A0ABN7SAJ2_OIKDI|nr:Oidioi.mRNA.OKI2018_I69.XSR.g14687.t1.cds [Oikopleura dioica]
MALIKSVLDCRFNSKTWWKWFCMPVCVRSCLISKRLNSASHLFYLMCPILFVLVLGIVSLMMLILADFIYEQHPKDTVKWIIWVCIILTAHFVFCYWIALVRLRKRFDSRFNDHDKCCFSTYIVTIFCNQCSQTEMGYRLESHSSELGSIVIV